MLAFAQATESLGFDGYFRSDHYLAMGDGDGLPGPTDAWTTLAGLARETSRIRLGTLVSSATFRHPGILAIQVAQVDQMSGGRAELGLGTGWFREEHEAYGIPFPEKRFGLLEEQLAVITGLWSTPIGTRFDFAGDHYTLVDAPALPKPSQSRVPVIVGGGGPKRTPAIAAKFATEYNIGFVDEDTIAAKFAVVRAACEDIGRDAADLTYSAALPTTIGGPAHASNLTGSAAEIVDKLGRLGELGTDRVYLQLMDTSSLDDLERLGAEVLPQLR